MYVCKREWFNRYCQHIGCKFGNIRKMRNETFDVFLIRQRFFVLTKEEKK